MDNLRTDSHARNGSDHLSSQAGGAILILLGFLFLAWNLGLIPLSGNWWAAFLLIPTVVLFGSALQTYSRNGGRLTRPVAGQITGGIFPLAVALIFLLHLNWGQVWPIFIVLAGLSALLQSYTERS